jgi:hemolysin activation/secretion protein
VSVDSDRINLALAMIVALVVTASPVIAQEDEEERQPVRGIEVTPDESDAGDLEEAEPPAAIDSALPPLPATLPGGDIATQDRVQISRVILEGNTVLPVDDVDALLARFTDRDVTMDQLHELRYALTSLYVQNGYVSSGVVIPDQRLNDGVVQMVAVEGRVTRISVFGNNSVRAGYVRNRVERGIGTPVHTGDLRFALEVLRADPRIERVNAELLPGARPGESTLQVNLTETVSWWVATTVDNYRSPSVDENRVSVSAGNNNFTGHGDVLALDYGLTDGLDDIDASYSFPLTSADLRLTGYYGSTDSNIVEAPFNLVDIVSQSETAGISLAQPFHSRSGRIWTTTVGLENRRNENWLLGMPFSFTAGEHDGTSEVSVAYLTAQLLWPSPGQMFGAMISGRFGTELFDATTNITGPDSDFFALRAQLQYARDIGWRSSRISVRASGQFASDPLLALEKYSIGGHSTVRGYRENQLVRDNAIVTTVEIDIPLLVDDDGRPTHDLWITPFADYGVGWDENNASLTSRKTDLASVGIGIRWRPDANWLIRADYGHALDEVVTPTESLQDKGLQFRVEYRMTPNR